jgi:hypothetical protein
MTSGPDDLFADLPYRVHTNSELELMLAGTKPMAMFGHWLAEEDFHEELLRPFREHPRTRHFIYRRLCWIDERPAYRSIRTYVARPGEEWRIDAHIAMWTAVHYSGWNDGFERLEGFLLGYEAWQNEAFIQWQAKRAAEGRMSR